MIGLARRVEIIRENAEKLKGEKGELHGLKVDLRNSDEITNSFKLIEEQHGPVHVLVNNAGDVEFTSLSDGEVEDWKKSFDINVMGKKILYLFFNHNIPSVIFQLYVWRQEMQ